MCNVVRWIFRRRVYIESTCIHHIQVDSSVWQCAWQCAVVCASVRQYWQCAAEQIQFGRVVIPNLTLPGNPGSNLILVTEIEIQFVFPDESRKLPRIQLRGNIFLRRLSVASFGIGHPSRGQTFFFCGSMRQRAVVMRQCAAIDLRVSILSHR
jgi:hypothetical protein